MSAERRYSFRDTHGDTCTVGLTGEPERGNHLDSVVAELLFVVSQRDTLGSERASLCDFLNSWAREERVEEEPDPENVKELADRLWSKASAHRTTMLALDADQRATVAQRDALADTIDKLSIYVTYLPDQLRKDAAAALIASGRKPLFLYPGEEGYR